MHALTDSRPLFRTDHCSPFLYRTRLDGAMLSGDQHRSVPVKSLVPSATTAGLHAAPEHAQQQLVAMPSAPHHSGESTPPSFCFNKQPTSCYKDTLTLLLGMFSFRGEVIEKIA